jgi:hypothetical protein
MTLLRKHNQLFCYALKSRNSKHVSCFFHRDIFSALKRFTGGYILHAAWFCTFPVRAFISIERKTGKAALLPVRAFISFLLTGFPYGEEETGGTRFSIDMIPLTGNAQNHATHSINVAFCCTDAPGESGHTVEL